MFDHRWKNALYEACFQVIVPCPTLSESFQALSTSNDNRSPKFRLRSERYVRFPNKPDTHIKSHRL